MIEYIQDVKTPTGISRILYYKPEGYKWTSASLRKDTFTKDYMITGIKHEVDLPDDVRPMHKSEYCETVLRHFDFIDMQYSN